MLNVAVLAVGRSVFAVRVGRAGTLRRPRDWPEQRACTGKARQNPKQTQAWAAEADKRNTILDQV